jgi:hypothetical protein
MWTDDQYVYVRRTVEQALERIGVKLGQVTWDEEEAEGGELVTTELHIEVFTGESNVVRHAERPPATDEEVRKYVDTLIESFEKAHEGIDPVKAMYELIINFFQTHPGGSLHAVFDLLQFCDEYCCRHPILVTKRKMRRSY